MEKKLTKFDIMMVLGFIFALTVGVAAFFFGLQTGKEQTDAKYKAIIAELVDEKNQDNVSYHQQQLVSFYHTVLLPFREFQDRWFRHAATIEAGGGSTDADALLKELGRLAKEISEEIKPTTIPEVSPLLRDAQANYLKSLALFAAATDRLQKGPDGAALAESMRQDDYVAEAASFALKAQAEYYDAIWQWHAANEPVPVGAELIEKNNLTFEEWRTLPLNGKNLFLARLLAEVGAFSPFYPQDVAARIDDLDAAGRVGQLQLADLRAAVSTLLSTGAVRSNDYFQSKEKHYRGEKLPQLPFFY
ncbi:hypothetical protein [Paenibacillus sp.]|uniref:hypothetical protein n=1 Tax=Paenibacillus sp. TaxID=58172 RepID=UPI002D663F50|nr:hypothetical protein [Paenibacillus sp.]HZG55447.1 hypothetical protein [Paenibacillus sp.]